MNPTLPTDKLLLNLWLFPNLFAALVGAWFLHFRRSNYRLTLLGSLVMLTLLALLFAWTGDGLRMAFRHRTEFRPLEFWWETGCLLTVPLAFIAGARFVNDYYVVFVERK